MGYGNAKAIFEHEFNPWLTKSYKNLWFIKGWKVRMFWNWYPSSRSMIGWLMINGCVPQRLAQTVAWFKPCSCLFTKWGSLTAQSGLERSFLKASGTQCSATCQPSTPRTFLPAFVQRYFQTPVSIQNIWRHHCAIQSFNHLPARYSRRSRRSEVLMRLCHRGMLLSLQGLVPICWE